jgi:hypothetical protein
MGASERYFSILPKHRQSVHDLEGAYLITFKQKMLAFNPAFLSSKY